MGTHPIFESDFDCLTVEMASKSKFWNVTDSESDSDSESSSGSEEIVREVKQKKKVKVIVDDSESEEEKRPVKNLKDKRFDEIREICKKSRDTRKNNDLNAAMNLFEDLKKSFSKSIKVIEREGTPRFYIRELFEVEKYVANKWEDKDFKKKLSKDKSKSLSTLRQRIKKCLQQEEKINAEFDEYKNNPDASDAESEEEVVGKSESESEDELSSSDEEVVAAAAVKTKAKTDWSGSDDESDWTDSDDESDSSSDFDSDEGTGGEGEFARYTIAYFLKKPEGPKKRSEQDKKKPRKQRETKKEKNDSDDESDSSSDFDSD